MDVRIPTLLLCCLVLAGACTSDGEPEAGPSQPESADAYELGGECDGLGRLRNPQLSFVSGGRMFLAPRGASVASCAVEVEDPSELAWGAAGDRLHFGDLRRYDGQQIVALDAEAESVSWSRPTGTSLVYVSAGRLMKVDAFGSEPFDISFLADHDEVVYHPAGTHVAVTGTSGDGTYGLWLATNVGEEPQLIAIGEDARRIFSLSFAHDGTTLYYAAEHDDRYDVHSLRIALQDEDGPARDAELGTLDSNPTDMGDVVASEFAENTLAFSAGSCEQGKTTRVWNGEVTELGGELAGLSTEPAGWLPNGELLVLARAEGCEGPGTLYAWQPNRTTRLVSDVSVAGVRAVLPPPPDPPGSDQPVAA